MTTDYFRNKIIEEATGLQSIFSFRPIIKQNWNNRKDLFVYTMLIAFMHAHHRIPAIGFHLPEKFITYHHPRPAITTIFEMNKFAIAKFLHPTRDVAWHDVGMYVDFQCFCVFMD